MKDEYLVIAPAAEITEHDLQRIQEELADVDPGPSSLSYESFDPTQDINAGESDVGFGFNWIEILPVIEFLIVGYHIGDMTGGNERLLHKLRELVNGDELIELNSKAIASDPAGWVGTDVWDQLSTETKEDLQKSYDALHTGSEAGTILHSAFAIEHLIEQFCASHCSEVPDDVWTDGVDLVQAQITPDQTANLFSNLEFVNKKRHLVNDHDESITEDDAVSTVVSTRTSVRAVIEARSQLTP
jgi:hypothetical protein